ncbi:MAG: hypothetical protein WD470_00425 [Rhodospirillaceae bacterium]
MTDSPFEKTGNANWAQCPDCDHWFHVATALLRMETVDLICPECSTAFLPRNAKAMIQN